MKKKTYGVSGYIEWIAGINTGSATVQVPFTGGAITKYGVVPAEYTTRDPVIQHLIENSELYYNKRIFLIREEAVSEGKSQDTGKRPDTTVTIKVSNLTDAAEVLRDRCGVPTAKITSAEEAMRIARDNKIIFIGI